MVSADSGMLDVLMGGCSVFCNLAILFCAQDERTRAWVELLSPSSLDFGEIALARSFGLRQTSSKTEQIWGSPLCAEVYAVTAVLQAALRYSLNAYSGMSTHMYAPQSKHTLKADVEHAPEGDNAHPGMAGE